jgi:WD40 repeat protein
VIHLWDVAARQERCRLVGHTGSITTLAFQPQGAMLISGSYDTTVRLWDVKSADREKVTQRGSSARAN